MLLNLLFNLFSFGEAPGPVFVAPISGPLKGTPNHFNRHGLACCLPPQAWHQEAMAQAQFVAGVGALIDRLARALDRTNSITQLASSLCVQLDAKMGRCQFYPSGRPIMINDSASGGRPARRIEWLVGFV